MSSFDIINFLMISDVDRGSKNQEHLNDLRDRAGYIGKKTGQDPMSWYEFQQNVPREAPKTVTNMVLGSGIGLAVGLGIGMFFTPVLLPLAISGAFLGGAAGVFSDTENTRRNSLVQKYEDYLNGFESVAIQGRSPSPDIHYKDTHALEVRDRQASAPGIAK